MPKILVIDDQEENLRVISSTLSMYIPDCTIYTALGGLDGLEKGIDLNPVLDLIITDIRMPDIDGFELCRRLKSDEGPRIRHFVPILILSAAFTESEHRVKGLKHGADGYLSRPYSNDELVAQVQVLLRIKQSEDRLRAHEEHLEGELARRNEELIQSQKNFHKLFDASPDAILVESQAGLIIAVNPAAQLLTGIRQEELVGCKTDELFADAQDQTEQQMQSLLDGEHSQLRHATIKRKFEQIPVEIRTKNVVYDEQEARMLLIRDVSERKAAEEHVRAVQKMDAVSRLAGGIAHDFNNLLTSVLGYAQLIAEVGKDNPQITKDIKQIIQSAERATDLTRQLLVFGRRQTFPSHPVNVNQVVVGTDQLLRRALGEQIELVTLLGENIGWIHSDEGHIEQIVLNLVVNAREAMPEGGKIIIETQMVELDETTANVHFDAKPGHYVLLSVRDEGHGITERIRDKIFDPYFTTKKDSAATGLGLSTVYGIVKQAGGFIHVTSEPTRGSVFRIYLPESHLPDDIPQPVDDPNQELPTGTETVLVVEDEDLVRALCIRILSGLGYKTIDARNGSEGLRIAEEHDEPIDLLLTDVVMPVMGGPDLYHELTKQQPGLKVLYVSGFTDERMSELDSKSPDTLMLRKPYTRRQIATHVRALLDQTEVPKV